MIDLTEIDKINFEDVDFDDYPDFSDAFISSADYKGRPMTESELDELNSDYSDYVHEELIKYLY